MEGCNRTCPLGWEFGSDRRNCTPCDFGTYKVEMLFILNPSLFRVRSNRDASPVRKEDPPRSREPSRCRPVMSCGVHPTHLWETSPSQLIYPCRNMKSVLPAPWELISPTTTRPIACPAQVSTMPLRAPSLPPVVHQSVALFPNGVFTLSG